MLPVEWTACCPGWKSKDRPGTVRSVRGGWETWKGTSMCEYAKNVELENNRLQQLIELFVKMGKCTNLLVEKREILHRFSPSINSGRN